MAIKVADKTKTVRMWTKQIFFPQDNYIARIISQDHKPNSNGNPMTTLEWEIVNCDPKKVGDETFEFDGVTFPSYHVTEIKPPSDADDKELAAAAQSSENQFNMTDALFQKLGVDTSEGWDPENPPKVLGKIAHLRLYGQDQPAYKAATPEEKAAGKKMGEKLKDPITGKDVHSYQIKIAEVYGLFDGEVRPF